MDKAIYYKLINGECLLLSDKLGYYCSPWSYSLHTVIMKGLEEVGWDSRNVSTRELAGAKPVMRGEMLRW